MTRCHIEDVREAWRDASRELRLAHEDWCAAGAAHRRERYAVLVAAADREAAAGDALARGITGVDSRVFRT